MLPGAGQREELATARESSAVALAIFPKPSRHAESGCLKRGLGGQDCAGGRRFLACSTEACEGGWYPLPKSSVLMPSANASRKGQEKPREIVDAAEVGFILPRVRERAEGGSGAKGPLFGSSCQRFTRRPVFPRTPGAIPGCPARTVGTVTLGTVWPRRNVFLRGWGDAVKVWRSLNRK